MIIWTNTFDNLDKYIAQFEDALIAVSWRRTLGLRNVFCGLLAIALLFVKNIRFICPNF